MQGFIDDSGQGQGNIFTLAGFLSTPERWKQFSEEWKIICDKEPKTPNFKMVKARQLVGSHYSQAQIDKRIRDLTDLTMRKAMFRIDAVTANPNYTRIVKGAIPEEVDSVYFVLFFAIISLATRMMDMQKLEGTVDFIFDRQGSSKEEECVRWYNWIKSNPRTPVNMRRRLGNAPIFCNDDKVLPLKAADMLAWHIRRHLNEEQPKNIEPGEYLNRVNSLFGVSCLLRPEDLASFAYSFKSSGLMIQGQISHLVPRTG